MLNQFDLKTSHRPHSKQNLELRKSLSFNMPSTAAKGHQRNTSSSSSRFTIYSSNTSYESSAPTKSLSKQTSTTSTESTLTNFLCPPRRHYHRNKSQYHSSNASTSTSTTLGKPNLTSLFTLRLSRGVKPLPPPAPMTFRSSESSNFSDGNTVDSNSPRFFEFTHNPRSYQKKTKPHHHPEKDLGIEGIFDTSPEQTLNQLTRSKSESSLYFFNKELKYDRNQYVPPVPLRKSHQGFI